MIKKGFYFISLLLLATHTVQAAIYKWVDDNGVTHFSDAPHEGAQTVNLPKMKVYAPEPDEPVPPQKVNTKKTLSDELDTVNYSLFEIASPANKATIRDNQGIVPINLAIEPKLSEQDSIQIYLDGKKVGTPQTKTSFKLDNVHRGEHQLMAEIIDVNGKPKAKTPSVTIYVFRAFVRKNAPNAPHS